MSDNFKIIGVGGAGVNIVKELGYENSLFIDSSRLSASGGVDEFVRAQPKGGRVVIVSSPAGQFSSSVLNAICSGLNSRGNRVFFVGIMPFHSESPERRKRGEEVMMTISRMVDSAAVVENENFASSMMEFPFSQVMARINRYVDEVVKKFLNIDVGPNDSVTETSGNTQRQAEFRPGISVGFN